MIYSIEPVKKSDLEELLNLMQEHADYEKAEFSPKGKKERLAKAFFTKPQKLNCWVIEAESELIGYVTFTFDYSTWDATDFMYMDCLYLREQVRGQGIGTEILNLLKDIAAKHNCINIQWQTPVFNESAIRFYNKNKAISNPKVRFTLT